jgi:two-component system NarL family response regulator
MTKPVDQDRIRVIVVDDHTLMREGVAAVIARQPDMIVVGEAVDDEDAIVLVERKQPDVLLLDLRMPKLNGVAVIERLCPKRPGLAIVVLYPLRSEQNSLLRLHKSLSRFVNSTLSS